MGASMVLLALLIAAQGVQSSRVNSLWDDRTKSILPIPPKTNPLIISSIAAGTQLALDYCQNSFQFDRWNCPNSTFTKFPRLLPSKETAFVKAIIAAGITYEITRKCSSGTLQGCGCDDSSDKLTGKVDPWKSIANMTTREFVDALVRNNSKSAVRQYWGGCSDDPSFAINVTLKYLFHLNKDLKPGAFVARHNSKVGSEMIRRALVQKCRCHGISGSCVMQSCSMQLPSFEEISRQLKDSYKKAERLSQRVVEEAMAIDNRVKRATQDKEIEGVGGKLVFLVQSPDYCLENQAEGISGTLGRVCSKNINSTFATERNSCKNLCRKCGYAVKRMKKTVTTLCNCKFEWCCEVQCDTCHEEVDEFFCV